MEHPLNDVPPLSDLKNKLYVRDAAEGTVLRII
jgi:hypothetical protein